MAVLERLAVATKQASEPAAGTGLGDPEVADRSTSMVDSWEVFQPDLVVTMVNWFSDRR